VSARDLTGRTTTSLRRSTATRDQLLANRYVLPRFGDHQLARITQREVRAWVAELSASGLAPATVQKCYLVLRKAMAAAVEAGMIARTPCRHVSLPRVERGQMRFLSPGEVARLANAIDPRYRALRAQDRITRVM
jgi:site-specific recombinase XerD